MDKGDLEKLFKKIRTTTLEEIFSELKLGTLEKKSVGVDILKEYALESGARTLIQQLKLETLKAISSDLKFYDEVGSRVDTSALFFTPCAYCLTRTNPSQGTVLPKSLQRR